MTEAPVLRRRKITPSYHERMIWGRGDGSGLTVAETRVGRVGALACWEHYNPLARFVLMTEREQIHCAQFPGSMVGPIFADQIEVTIRHHALESGCFVINATGWLTPEQVAHVTEDEKLQGTLQGGCCSAIISPEGAHLQPPLREGEGMVVADLDFALITKRKRMLDSVGHYARPDLFQLRVDRRRTSTLRSCRCLARAWGTRLPIAMTVMTRQGDFHSQQIKRRQRLIAELQSYGLWLESEASGVSSRRGGAGPSDHQAVTVMGTTVMVPVHTHAAVGSPFRAKPISGARHAQLFRDGEELGVVTFPPRPKFYDLQTQDGVPYWKIAQLHAKDVLATTVLQNCIRYPDVRTRCQFCAIGESLHAGRTIATKSPAQLAEVAEAARRLDGVTHMVMTTGTTPTPDRGAAVLAECAAQVTQRAAIPIQAQCEPPDDFAWFDHLRASGVTALGMHLEAFDPDVRARIMPGKAEVPVAYYMDAYRAAVRVFGSGEVTTYLLAGLGDSRNVLLEGCRQLIEIGVYPFVVPFVPITGTPLEHAAPPSSEFMMSVLAPLGQMLRRAGMTSDGISAGCGKCVACSPLSTFEHV